MQRNEWIEFLSGILQEDIGALNDHALLADLVYWDSMAQLVVMAKLHEAGSGTTPKQIRNLQTLNELILFIS
jgi:hypothetical protein